MRLMAEGGPLVPASLEPPSPGPRGVLVKVEAAGVCHSDLHLISGSYDLGEGRRLTATGGGSFLPLTPGHEIAGSVAEIGRESASAGLEKGDHVIVYPWVGCGSCRKCLSGRENLCEGSPNFLGFMKDGGYAEYALVPDPRYLVRAEGMDPSQSATLPCSGLTAFSAVGKCGLRPDELLVIIGAGGVGMTALQIAKKVKGVRVVIADIDEGKLELAKNLGADHALNTSRSDQKEAVKQVKSINDGRGADAVIDFVGNPTTASLGLRLLGRESPLVLVGLAGGSLSLPLPILPLTGSRIAGNFTGTLDELVELVGLAKKGVVSPVVTESHRLEDANEVLARLGRGEIKGRAVLQP